MNDRTDAVLASIDGALADAELPDAMRWSPVPDAVEDPGPIAYDGEIVPQPPQAYEDGGTLPRLRRLIAEQEALHRERAAAVSLTRPYAQQSHAEPPGSPLHAAVNLTEEQRAAFRRAAASFAVPHPEIPRPEIRRLSDHNPPLRLEIPVQVLAVERTESGLTVVSEIAPGDVAALGQRILDGLSVAIRPVLQEFGRVFDSLAGALGLTQPRPAPPGSPVEEIRAAALALRQQRHTGPPVLGPERSPRPRRIR